MARDDHPSQPQPGEERFFEMLYIEAAAAWARAGGIAIHRNFDVTGIRIGGRVRSGRADRKARWGVDRVKALTLTAPWAHLIAAGAKRIETRSWRTDYRGQLAIHAAVGFPLWARGRCFEEPFYSRLFGATVMEHIARG